MAHCVYKYTACPRKRHPKYIGVVFEVLGKHDWNFYNRIRTLCAKIRGNL